MATIGDAPTHDYTQTVVQYAPGQQAKAAFLKNMLNAGAAVEPDSTLSGADVTVVLGQDYDGLRSVAASGATTVSSTPGSAAPYSAPDTTKPKPPPC